MSMTYKSNTSDIHATAFILLHTPITMASTNNIIFITITNVTYVLSKQKA